VEVGAGLALSGRGFLLVGGAVCSRQLPPEQAVVGDSPQRVLHLGLGPQVCGHRVPGGGGVAGGGGALFLLPVAFPSSLISLHLFKALAAIVLTG
jgi:hypothetical protein